MGLNKETITCDICGAICIADYSYSIAAFWLVTGGAGIASFGCDQCEGNQHWGCSPEHAIQSLLNCLQYDSHLSANRMSQLRASKPRVSEADDFDERNPRFHVLREGTT